MWHGLIIVNKERGPTSHQVVAKLRQIFGQSAIGHTGTLDPDASGVLVVGLGQATRFFSFFDEAVKVYRATMTIGQATDTQDAAGRIVTDKPETAVDRSSLEKAISEMTGETYQLPPMYSAVKVMGQKLYDLARRGVEIERSPRLVKVFEWRLLDVQARYNYQAHISFEISCSRGTYIRTLIHDLGQKLGCGAHIADLERVKSGIFDIGNAHTIPAIRTRFDNGRIQELLLPVDAGLRHLCPLYLQAEDRGKMLHGGKLSFNKYPMGNNPGSLVRFLDADSRLVAVARLVDSGNYYYWQPVKVWADDPV